MGLKFTPSETYMFKVYFIILFSVMYKTFGHGGVNHRYQQLFVHVMLLI